MWSDCLHRQDADGGIVYGPFAVNLTSASAPVKDAVELSVDAAPVLLFVVHTLVRSMPGGGLNASPTCEGTISTDAAPTHEFVTDCEVLKEEALEVVGVKSSDREDRGEPPLDDPEACDEPEPPDRDPKFPTERAAVVYTIRIGGKVGVGVGGIFM